MPADAPSAEAYAAFARRIRASGLISDPWIDGEPRFEEEPELVSPSFAHKLARAATDVGELWDEAVQIVIDEPSLLEDFFGLTPTQRAMFEATKPLWHGIARADVFVTDEGLQIAELNCDTPTGEAEAVVLGRLAKEAHPKLIDPNEGLGKRFIAMILALRDALVGPDAAPTVGIVYPTEFTEDLSLVKLYRSWLEEAGLEVALGSPYNLRRTKDDPTARVFEEPVGVLLRHYKTDWWSERASAWDDEELADTSPLAKPLLVAIGAQAEGKTVVVNPFGAVLAQNKRMMALMWEHIHRFSLRSQERIRALVPVTQRLESMHGEMLRVQREEWVIKSDYGAEGDEVIVGKLCTQELWEESLTHARKGRWIAQRYFEAARDPRGRTTNYGVFLIAGEPAGLYVRKQVGATDPTALSVPVLIQPES